MKVKIISYVTTKCSDTTFEERINEFVKDKNIIDIKYSFCDDGNYFTQSALIMYNE